MCSCWGTNNAFTLQVGSEKVLSVSLSDKSVTRTRSETVSCQPGSGQSQSLPSPKFTPKSETG
jgi:hypothetical protein